MHLDVIVDDLDAAEVAVLDLGATKHPHQPGTSFRVFLDPARHGVMRGRGDVQLALLVAADNRRVFEVDQIVLLQLD